MFSSADDKVFATTNNLANMPKPAKKFTSLKLAQMMMPSFADLAYLVALTRAATMTSFMRQDDFFASYTKTKFDNKRVIGAGHDGTRQDLRVGITGLYQQHMGYSLITMIR